MALTAIAIQPKLLRSRVSNLACIRPTPGKPNCQAAVALVFVEDVRAFFAEPDAIKRDEIAARQLHALKQHHAGKLRLSDVHTMLLEMKDYA